MTSEILMVHIQSVCDEYVMPVKKISLSVMLEKAILCSVKFRGRIKKKDSLHKYIKQGEVHI
jgi:hypothetical protein